MNINRELQGRLFFDNGDKVILDLATGGVTHRYEGRFRQNGNGRPTLDGTEAVYVDQSDYLDGILRVVIQDIDDRTLSYFELEDDSLSGEVKLSPDHQTNGGIGLPVRVISLADPSSYIRVSPDGDRLAFVMVDRIWISALDGSEMRRLTASHGSELSPVWSPDGKYNVLRLHDKNYLDPPYL